MHKYDITNGRRWNESHPAWPRKPDGTPYKRPPKDKVPATLCDGVTSILGIMTPYYLVPWVAKLAIAAGVDELEEALRGVDEFRPIPRGVVLERLIADRYKKTKNEAAEVGTKMHKAAEQWISRGVILDGYEDIIHVITNAITGLKLADGGENMVAEHQFAVMRADGLSYGGTMDLLCRESRLVCDWKFTKDDRNPHLSECAQVAAYGDAVFGAGSQFRAVNILVNQQTRKLICVREWTRDEIAIARRYFELCYRLKGLNDRWGG
jgi:hypothetical protein